MISFNLNYLLKGPLFKCSNIRVRASTYLILGEHKSVHNNFKNELKLKKLIQDKAMEVLKLKEIFMWLILTGDYF